MIVLSHVGARLGEKVRAEVPGVEVVDLDFGQPPPGDLRGEVLVTFPFRGAPAPYLDHLDALGVRWVHLASTGVDGFPLDRLGGRTVTCARGASAVPIAEFVLAAMLAFEKRMPDVWLREPPEHWGWTTLGALRGRTLGIVGLGGIGAEVARLGLAFGMEVVAVRRRPEPSPVPGVSVAGGLDEVLAAADHLVVAAPATDHTRHLLDERAFGLVKPGVHLVNIARGSLVDQDALRAALDDGRVAMASLDVAEPEPPPEGHWLYAHPGVRLSPHVSWSSPELLAANDERFVANLVRYLAGEPLHGVVDIAEGY